MFQMVKGMHGSDDLWFILLCAACSHGVDCKLPVEDMKGLFREKKKLQCVLFKVLKYIRQYNRCEFRSCIYFYYQFWRRSVYSSFIFSLSQKNTDSYSWQWSEGQKFTEGMLADVFYFMEQNLEMELANAIHSSNKKYTVNGSNWY